MNIVNMLIVCLKLIKDDMKDIFFQDSRGNLINLAFIQSIRAKVNGEFYVYFKHQNSNTSPLTISVSDYAKLLYKLETNGMFINNES